MIMPMPGPRNATNPNLKTLGDTAQANPSHIWIEPTNRCNTRCRHCQHYYADFGSDMSEEVFGKIQDCALAGARAVEVQGYGEPLVAPLFDRIMDACLARGMSVAFTSNGILLRDDRRVVRLVRQKVHITLSIEGARAETHEFVRPYVKWAGMLETLECLKRNAEAAGAERRFTLGINFTVLKKNVNELPDVVLLAARYGATRVNPGPLIGGDTGHNDLHGQSLIDAPEMLVEPLTKAMRLASEHGIALGVPAVFREILWTAGTGRGGSSLAANLHRLRRKAALALDYLRQRGLRQALDRLLFGFGPKAKAGKRLCLMPWHDAYFAADGRVTPCCTASERMGDLNEETWSDIWNGPLYRSMRRTIHSWNPSAGCRVCGLSMGINGGDERQYDRFFARFREEVLPLDSPEVVFAEGFSPMEYRPDGAASHRWMGLRGTLELPRPPRARFLRLAIIPRQPIPTLNPGRCRVVACPGAHWSDEGAWEPFDNTCPELHFPIDHIRSSGRIRLEIEMENAPSTSEDARPLGLAVRGVAYLLAP